jgi:hypothetical protein
MLWLGEGGGVEPPLPVPPVLPAPFDQLWGFFQGAISFVSDSVQAVWNGIVDALGALWGNLINAFSSLWFSIIQGFDNLWRNFWVNSLPSWADINRGIKDVWDGFVSSLDILWRGIVAAIDNLYHSIWDALTQVGNWILARLYEIIGRWDLEKNRFVGGFLGWLWDAIGGVMNYVFSLFAGFGQWLTDCFDWLHSEVVGWLTGAMAAVATALGEAGKALWTFFTSTIPGFLVGAGSWLNENVLMPIMRGLQWIFDRISDGVQSIISSVIGLFGGPHPMEGPEAISLAIMGAGTTTIIGASTVATVCFAGLSVLGCGVDMDALATFAGSLSNPSLYVNAVLGTLVHVALEQPIEYYYQDMFRPTKPDVDTAKMMYWRGSLTLEQYKKVIGAYGYRDVYENGFLELTKNIPGSGDLISMVVREAFDPSNVVEAPTIFAEYMVKQGFAKEWSDRYWTAHYTPIALNQAYANLWRGFWTETQFFEALKIADIHPRWHKDILAVAFRPPSARELGYGFDTGLYTVEDITRYRRAAGLSPDDAAKAASALVAYRLDAEREALRREALADYIGGLDGEAELRTNLANIGGRPEMINLWVSRAKYREERDERIALIKVVKDQFVKGLLTEDELRSSLKDLGVVSSRLEIHVIESVTRKTKAAKEVTAEKKKQVTEAKLSQAWELGLVGDGVYAEDLVDRGYTREDAQMLLEILRTPKPITVEEVERRKKAITARINSTRRRYERLIRALDLRAGTVSSEINALSLEMKEVFDVIDTEIRSLDEELRGVTPEVVTRPILEAIANVNRRYERMLARLDRQAAAVTEEIPATERIYAETLDVIDVTIIYVEEELALALEEE